MLPPRLPPARGAVEVTAAVLTVIVSSSVLAAPNYERAVKFGDEVVTLKLSNVPPSPELDRLWDATNEAADPIEQERLYRIRWEDYGETISLLNLSMYYLERGDLVSAYARMYAVDKIAKWYVSVSPAAVKPGPLRKRLYLSMEQQLELVGSKLTESQREAGEKLAAVLVRNNPNCCTPI